MNPQPFGICEYFSKLSEWVLAEFYTIVAADFISFYSALPVNVNSIDLSPVCTIIQRSLEVVNSFRSEEFQSSNCVASRIGNLLNQLHM